MSKEDLYNEEAKAKIKKLAESIEFAMMTVDLSEPPFHTIPMSTKKVDENGSIWFLTSSASTHSRHIEMEERALLTYADKGSMDFLSVYGQAKIITDRKIIKELYSKMDDAWFDGEDDPTIRAIEVKPSEANYYDTKDNKLVALFKIAMSSITGEQPALGETGELKIN